MKTINYFILLAFLISSSSCATRIKFPISPIAPAAEGAVKIKQDKNNNYTIDLTVKYLADPGRLSEPRKCYVVWIANEGGIPSNLGMLVSDKKNNASLHGVTSSKPTEVFVTAEDEGDVNWPGKQELFRTQRFSLK